MKIKFQISHLVLLFLIFLPLSFSYAWPENEAVTPYGDFCLRCGHYGFCKSPMSHEDAKKAMIEYYHKKGFQVELENKRGRFIRAKIKDSRDVVDVIIFDRRTGRIRSIY